MTATGASNAGDRITLALIGQKLDAMAEANKSSHEDIISQLRCNAAAVGELQIAQGKHAIEIENIKKDINENIKPEIKSLRNRDTWWSSINSIMIAIATYLGITK